MTTIETLDTMAATNTAEWQGLVRAAIRELYRDGPGGQHHKLVPEVRGAIRDIFGVNPQGLKE